MAATLEKLMKKYYRPEGVNMIIKIVYLKIEYKKIVIKLQIQLNN